KYFITTLSLFITATAVQAQIKTTLPIDTARQHRKDGPSIYIGSAMDTTKQREKGGTSLSIGSGGVKVNKDHDTADHAFEVQFGMLDLGVNTLIDNTDYLPMSAP